MSGKPGKTLNCMAGMLIVLLVVAMIGAAILIPWLDQNSHYDRIIEQKQDQLVRYQRLIATLPGLEAKLQLLKSDEKSDAYYLSAQDAAQGGISLQRRTEEFIESTGAELTSIQIVPGASLQSVDEVIVRLRLRAGIETLSYLLHEIEGSMPLLFVRKLSIRGLSGRRNKDVVNTTLDVNMDVSGYVRREAG